MNSSTAFVSFETKSISQYVLSPTIISLVLITCTIALAVYLGQNLGARPHVNEPPFISSKLPYIGHTIGIWKHKMSYYTILSAKYRHDVFTLPMFGGRLYIVTAPSLVAPIQRHYKALSFWFLEGAFTVKLGALSNQSAKILLENAAGREIGNSLVVDGMKETHAAMAAGLEQMTQVAVDIVASQINGIKTEVGEKLDLWAWLERNVALMTSGAVYGPTNPYLDPELLQGLKSFSEESTMLLIGFLPSVLAPKGYAGREKIVKGFKKYFAAGGPKHGSQLIRARFHSLTEYGISLEDISRFEAVNGFGILINTIPTAFWSVYHVFSDANLLATVRELVQPLLNITKTDNGDPLFTIDIRQIKEIPLLVSILHEVLRYHASGAAARMVMEDFTLEGKYLFKKDSMLLIPNREIHSHGETWGENVGDFDAFRFIKNTTSSKKPPSGAFRGFGSGVNLCPGKNFATAEILALIAMMVLRFDITPVLGTWAYPGDNNKNMSTVICSPDAPVPVEVRLRQGRELGTWVFKATS
ncbi:25-hydroxycholesterol 7-alpha-hydroxylase [Lachnellula occidentalis]|uniref:25-hydroxycholesterol 7-alpha-hydroxylase n=1 Tax=Lachnellula occidentalis TaxID=215460 RepID=A0A8H8UDR5_9HELO|nr:25-hydroxycholesterol 7-alpha-hydroxylase [Lachnellula occidentalis]